MPVKPDFLRANILSDQPMNWLIHAEGFHSAGLKLIEAYEKLGTSKKLVSTEDIFLHNYNYKVAIYLLSHSIELLLKALISVNNLKNSGQQPTKYSHSASKMFKDLIAAGILIKTKESEEDDDEETIKLIDEYLQWFGRYYCPLPSKIDEVIEKAYTEPDAQGLIDFKYNPKYPETHLKLDRLFQNLKPSIPEGALTLPYLLHSS